MIIQNAERTYEVLRHLGGTEQTEEYLCADPAERGENTFLLVRIADPVLAKRFTLFLDERVKGGSFTDFREAFLEKGDLYAAFRYSVQPTLKEKLASERCERPERAQIAWNLLERLLLLSPHPWLAWNALEKDQVTVSPALEISFRYHFLEIEQPEELAMEDVCGSLEELFRLLFERELKKKLYPSLDEYVRKLGAGEGASYLRLYREFAPIYAELRDGAQEEKPKTFWFRLWERIKKILSFLRKVLMAVIVVAALFYMITVLQDDSGSRVTEKTMHQIGDLYIE